jgi:hypothetical protein
MITSIPFVEPIATNAPLAADFDCIAVYGRPCVGIRAGSIGSIAVEMATGATVAIKSVWAGETIWLQASKILAVGTSVENMLIYFDVR